MNETKQRCDSGTEFRRRRLGAIVVVAGIAGIAFLLASLFESSPLLKAVKSGDLLQVKKLLSENPNSIHSRTLMGDTALHLAVASGKSDIVSMLIESGADVNAKGESGVTPLHLAAFHGSVAITEMLLNSRADINAIGFRHKDTPLQVAAANGRAGVVELLLTHGADANTVDMLGKTALQLAEENHHTNVIAILKNPPSRK